MNVNIGFVVLIFSFCYSIILNVSFFTKKHVDTVETNIFGKMAFTNLFGIILELMCIFSIALIGQESIYTIIVNKLFLVYFVVILYLFMNYVINTTNSNLGTNNKKLKFSSLITKIVMIIAIISLAFLKVNIFNENGIAYSYGPAVNMIYILSTLTSLFSFVALMVNVKTLKRKNNIPIIAFLLLMGATAVIQQFYPQLTLATSVETFVIFLMYFTIENPDLKMLQEYTKNKQLVEDGLVSRAGLLFKVTQDIKNPVRKIKLYSDQILNIKDVEEKNSNAELISQMSNTLLNSIDKIYDISSMDKSKIKQFESSYDIYSLFNQIVHIVKNKNKNVDFKYSISDTLSDKLYGDSARLKQVICSLIMNCNESQNNLIDLDIYGISRMDVCRLIITIQNNSYKLELPTINDILLSNVEIPDKEIKILDNMNLDLKLIKKIIDILGGILLINSDENGTTFKIIIDQVVNSEKKYTELSKAAKKFSNKKRVLIVDDDYKELTLLSNEFKRNHFDVVSVMHEDDCIERLNNDEFDYLLLDDEMIDNTAVGIIKNVDKIKMDKLVKIVMLDKSKESIKEHYVEDYSFVDYFLKENYKDEIKRVKEKY